MPKEITHWLIANNAICALEQESKLRSVIENNKSYYLLGAVIYDTPYSFLGLTKKQKKFKKLADRLHGASGENAFCPFKNIIRDIAINNEALSDKTLAFALGFLSHIVVDLNFHPMVFNLTGNYYSVDKKESSRAVSNHRWLETNLDLWYYQEAQKTGQRPVKYMKEFVKDIDHGTLLKILEVFCEAIGFKKDENTAKTYNKAVGYHSFFQRLFFVNLLRRTMILFLGEGHKTAALFYPPSGNFQGQRTVSYRHPVTGDKHNTTFNSLKENTEKKLITVLKEVNRIVYFDRSEENLNRFIDSLPDLSIETGLNGISSKVMKYFNRDFDRSAWILK